VQLGVRYQTTYRYAEAVGFSTHRVRLFPRGGQFTRVRRLHFSTNEGAAVRFGRDVFDNVVASCSFPDPTTELVFRLDLDVELEAKDPFHFLLESGALQLPFRYERELLSVLAPYRRPRTARALVVPCWEKPTPERPQPTVAALVSLNRALHECVGYERREEGAARKPAETLRLGKGACRDVAVLLAEILRQLGLAARLVSGYLREGEGDDRRAEGALHAWTEVYLPGAGWVGLDATNGVFCNDHFISAAVGIRPADVTPISGSYYHDRRVASEMTSQLDLVYQ
jgi:transglutaminase-like putative cysteine protease